jgi:hypothetical protein
VRSSTIHHLTSHVFSSPTFILRINSRLHSLGRSLQKGVASSGLLEQD